MLLKHSRDEPVRGRDEGSGGHSSERSEDEEGEFVIEERDDQVEDAESEETSTKYRFRGVEVGESAPE